MTAPSRLDWQKSASDDAIALARTQVRRADLPAGVEAALVAYEAVVGERKEKPMAYAVAADALAIAALGAQRAGFKWPGAIEAAVADVKRPHAPSWSAAYRLALAGKVWRVYRREP